MPNVNDQFFDGNYKDIWRAMIPEKLTEKEIEFMLPYFDLKPGKRVLDLMCGYGRHAIALGRLGVEVVAIDNLGDYTNEINVIAEKESLPIQALKSDVISFQISGLFDLVICMGNSLNFFNEEDVLKLLKNVSSHLKEGCHLLINTWSLAEIALEKFKETNSSDIAGFKFENKCKLLFQPTRIETESVITGKDGSSETKKAIDYLYSIEELKRILKQVNLKLIEVFSIPGRKKFTIGEPRAYLIAQRN